MDRSAEVQTIMQIMSKQDIQIKYAKEKADKWSNLHNTLVDSKAATQLLLNKEYSKILQEYSKILHDLTEKPQENAVEELKVDINVAFDNGEKVKEQVEESAEMSV